VLDNVKVQATPGYQFLLGSDILRGANMALEWVDVRPGVHVEWRWGPMRVSYTSPVVNPRGPAGDQVLGATQTVPEGTPGAEERPRGQRPAT
jgi:hypothetical protein